MEWLYYISFNNDEMIYFKQYRDDKFIKKMLKEAENFYNEHMLNFIPPELSEKDYDKNDSEETLTKLKFLEELRLKKKELEDTEKKVRDEIILECNNRNTICGDYKITKVITRGAVDYSAIDEIKNMDLNKHRKPSRESWRIG
jgi:hypothetical protein